MHIAILGGTSLIARDLISCLSCAEGYSIDVYSRRKEQLEEWLSQNVISKEIISKQYNDFPTAQEYDAIINFVGVGSPKKALQMGREILDVTLQFDDLVIGYLNRHAKCKYLFLSSGAVYGNNFHAPVNENSLSHWNVNNVKPQDWYGISKFYAECRHRAHQDLSIVDLRVFNYFSRSQSLNDGFFVTDALRSIKEKEIFLTSRDNIYRDYVGPSDFALLVENILKAEQMNEALDCYTLGPVSKMELLEHLIVNHGLRVEFCQPKEVINATGNKEKYFSLNKRAQAFGYSPKMNSLQTIEKELLLMKDLIQ